MDAGLDTGDVIVKRNVPVDEGETAGTLHDSLSLLGASLLMDAISKVAGGAATRTPQSDVGVTYANKIEKSEAKIDWQKPAAEIERQVRGLNPFPIAYFELNGERIKVFASEVIDESARNKQAGQVVSDKLDVACGAGIIRLAELQRPGKNPMPANELLKGFKIPVGTILL